MVMRLTEEAGGDQALSLPIGSEMTFRRCCPYTPKDDEPEHPPEEISMTSLFRKVLGGGRLSPSKRRVDQHRH
jgi:hypothetical protein